jgi:hypothetical protein
MQESLILRAVFGAGSAMHPEHTGRSLMELPDCISVRSLKALDMTGCAALVTAHLADCPSLQLVNVDGCTGLRELHLPKYTFPSENLLAKLWLVLHLLPTFSAQVSSLLSHACCCTFQLTHTCIMESGLVKRKLYQ